MGSKESLEDSYPQCQPPTAVSVIACSTVAPKMRPRGAVNTQLILPVFITPTPTLSTRKDRNVNWDKDTQHISHLTE